MHLRTHFMTEKQSSHKTQRINWTFLKYLTFAFHSKRVWCEVYAFHFKPGLSAGLYYDVTSLTVPLVRPFQTNLDSFCLSRRIGILTLQSEGQADCRMSSATTRPPLNTLALWYGYCPHTSLIFVGIIWFFANEMPGAT